MLNNQMADSQNELLSQRLHSQWHSVFCALIFDVAFRNLSIRAIIYSFRVNSVYGVLTIGIQMNCQNWFLDSNLAPSMLAGRSK